MLDGVDPGPHRCGCHMRSSGVDRHPRSPSVGEVDGDTQCVLVEVRHCPHPPSRPVPHQLDPAGRLGDGGPHRRGQPVRVGFHGEPRVVAARSGDHSSGGMEVGSLPGRARQQSDHRRVAPSLVEAQQHPAVEQRHRPGGDRRRIARLEHHVVLGEMGVGIRQTRKAPEPGQVEHRACGVIGPTPVLDSALAHDP